MKRWIRWQGVAVFLGVVIIFSIFWFLLIDSVVERMIEKSGTKAVGAKVELDKADLSIFPAGLKLIRLQIANPDKPMTNAVEIAQINLSLDTLNLLRRKIIIEEMTIDGIRMNTPRKKSGAVVSRPSAPSPVSKKAPKRGLCAAIEMPTLKVPDVSEILDREGLKSLKLLASLQTEIQTEKTKWQEILQSLPDKATFEGYRNRIDELKSKRKGPLGGLLGAAADVANIQKDLQRDLDHLNRARQDFDATMASLNVKLDQANKAPMKDVKRLTEKYTLSSEGLPNLSRLLLGYRLCGWAEKAIAWYNKLKPLLERIKKKEKGHEVVKPIRGKGVNVRFKEYAPLPDFLIRRAKTNLTLQDGDLMGSINHITPSQDILGIPLTFVFSGENMKRFKAISVDGTLNHVAPARSRDLVNSAVKGYKVENLTLSDKAELPFMLTRAVADLNVRALLSGDNVSANLTVGLSSVQLTGDSQEGAGPVAKAISSALSDISRFRVSADITGTLEDYDILLSSDLDRVLREAASKMLQQQAAQLKSELKGAIFAKVDGPLKQAKTSLGGFDVIGNELTNRVNLGSRLVKGVRVPF